MTIAEDISKLQQEIASAVEERDKAVHDYVKETFAGFDNTTMEVLKLEGLWSSKMVTLFAQAQKHIPPKGVWSLFVEHSKADKAALQDLKERAIEVLKQDAQPKQQFNELNVRIINAREKLKNLGKAVPAPKPAPKQANLPQPKVGRPGWSAPSHTATTTPTPPTPQWRPHVGRSVYSDGSTYIDDTTYDDGSNAMMMGMLVGTMMNQPPPQPDVVYVPVPDNSDTGGVAWVPDQAASAPDYSASQPDVGQSSWS